MDQGFPGLSHILEHPETIREIAYSVYHYEGAQRNSPQRAVLRHEAHNLMGQLPAELTFSEVDLLTRRVMQAVDRRSLGMGESVVTEFGDNSRRIGDSFVYLLGLRAVGHGDIETVDSTSSYLRSRDTWATSVRAHLLARKLPPSQQV